MSVNLPEHYTVSFSSNIALKLQQMGSKLRGTVSEGSYVGKQASPVNQIGSISMSPVTTRFAAMPRTDAAVDRRWVFPLSFDLNQMVDHFDKLKMVEDPESDLVRSAVLAAGREIDKVLITNFLATNYIGESGTSTVSFTAGNEVDVATGGSNSRLNVAKLRAVRELMESQFIDFSVEECYVGITAKDHSALLNEVQIINADYNDEMVLKEGKITRFLGFNLVHCELIETVAAGTNEVNLPVWCKSGVHLGMWEDIKTDISQRKDIQGLPWQAYVYLTCGATRLEENKVYNIESYRA